MTVYRNLNVNGSGGNWVIYYIKETLKSAGWTVPRSGSGGGGVFDTADVFGSVATGSNQVVGVGSGSETLGNADCWLVLQDPGGNREIIFLRDGTVGDSYDDEWWMGYSPGGLYIGGAAATSATATDEEVVTQGGSRGSPPPIHVVGGSSNLVHVAADDTASSAGEYGWVCIEVEATNTLQSLTFLDDYSEVATGDTSPLALNHDATSMATAAISASGGVGKTICDPTGTPTWLPLTLVYPTCGPGTYMAVGRVSEIDSNERPLPAYYIEGTAYGYRGVSRWFRWPGVARDYPNTAGPAGVEDDYYMDDAIIIGIGDGSTTPSAI